MDSKIQAHIESCKIEIHGVNGELLQSDFDYEKFAMLIAKDCISMCEKERDDSAGVIGRNSYGEPTWMIATGAEAQANKLCNMMKSYFGVTEVTE